MPYFVVTEHKTWQQAKQYCFDRDARLMEFRRPEDLERATEARQQVSSLLMWFGGTYVHSEQEGKWNSDGEPVTENWAVGYPVFMSNLQCLGLNENVFLQNTACYWRYQFACEVAPRFR